MLVWKFVAVLRLEAQRLVMLTAPCILPYIRNWSYGTNLSTPLEVGAHVLTDWLKLLCISPQYAKQLLSYNPL